ncbi:type-2 angiotensin II receptor [Micractinium conductrix]|uniref:Type-2 angiotensin II receptor n=1 Tax=Micractinium conductrix TaxID=554055 RepID=A0A2P6VGN4_9CHLO|nr:type-2 angiotensin II receptor [Micractinium conductrix]|eukprot:PSC73228.1 type-2 angiotensin II receptor [Micractinium conductrix]
MWQLELGIPCCWHHWQAGHGKGFQGALRRQQGQLRRGGHKQQQQPALPTPSVEPPFMRPGGRLPHCFPRRCCRRCCCFGRTRLSRDVKECD